MIVVVVSGEETRNPATKTILFCRLTVPGCSVARFGHFWFLDS